MITYDNSNQIAIWPNEKRKEEGANPNLPHFTGAGEVGGVKYRASCWKKAEDAHPNAPALKIKLEVY